MNENTEKDEEIIQLPVPDFGKIVCPHCKSREIIRNHSRWRRVADLGTKRVRKFLEFESIHFKCKSCSQIFRFEREEILPGVSVSKEVIDTILSYYYDFGNSERTIVKLMETFYSVEIGRHSIHRWIKKYGEDFCKKNNLKYEQNIESFSVVIGLDGTFPDLNLDLDDKRSAKARKKGGPSCLRLTQLQDGTLVAIWEEVKMNKK